MDKLNLTSVLAWHGSHNSTDKSLQRRHLKLAEFAVQWQRNSERPFSAPKRQSWQPLLKYYFDVKEPSSKENDDLTAEGHCIGKRVSQAAAEMKPKLVSDFIQRGALR